MATPIVRGTSEVWVNQLRAAAPNGFPMMDKPPFGYTDAIGEYAGSGFPTFDADQNIIGANDSVSIPGVGGTEFSQTISAVHPRHMFVPHDNLLTTYYGPPIDPLGENPQISWSNFAATDDTVPTQPAYPPGFAAIRYEPPTPQDCYAFGTPDVVCQGFSWIVKLGAPQAFTSPVYTSLQFSIWGSDAGDHRTWAISIQAGVGVLIGYNDNYIDGVPDPSTWQSIDLAKLGYNTNEVLTTTYVPAALSGTGLPVDPVPFVIEARLLGGILSLYFGDQQTPWTFPALIADNSGTWDWFIGQYALYAINVSMVEWSVHQTKFVTDAVLVSQEVNLGFIPSDDQLANIKSVIHFTPYFPYNIDLYSTDYQTGFFAPECFVYFGVYDLNGQTLRYYVQWILTEVGIYLGTPYGDFVSPIRAVTIDIPGSEISISASPILLEGNTVSVNADTLPPPPTMIDITHTWDQSQLTVNSTLSLTFDNFYGRFTNENNNGYCDDESAWQSSTGIGLGTHHWVQVQLGQDINGVPMTNSRGGPSDQFLVEFTGVGGGTIQNSWNGAGKDTVGISARDRWAMLDVPVWNLPWFDGWNVYSAIAYLAAIGTIGADGLGDYRGFASYVPYDSDTGAILFFAPSPGLSADQQYFLPSGPAGTALTRFGNGQNLRSIMLKISNTIGFALYFDVFGLLEFYKFEVSSSQSAVKTFTETATNDLQEIWRGSYTRSLEETRNAVTVIGINALGSLWFPLVAHEQDDDSIYDDAVGNYIGWVRPLVWVDSLFTNLGFAEAAAGALFNFLDLPDKQVSLQIWYPADTGVYPTDIVSLTYTRSGATGVNFFVVQSQTHMQNGQPTSMTVQARIVPTV